MRPIALRSSAGIAASERDGDEQKQGGQGCHGEGDFCPPAVFADGRVCVFHFPVVVIEVVSISFLHFPVEQQIGAKGDEKERAGRCKNNNLCEIE